MMPKKEYKNFFLRAIFFSPRCEILNKKILNTRARSRRQETLKETHFRWELLKNDDPNSCHYVRLYIR